MSDPTSDNPRFLEALIRAWLRLFGGKVTTPEMAEVVKVVRYTMVETALELEGENASRAASRVGISRRHLDRILGEPPWDTTAMDLDDSAFPLIRIHWPKDADGAFANRVIDWYLADILPRAEERDTKLVELLNWASLDRGLPSIEVLSTLKGRADDFLPASSHIIVNTVVFSPHVFLGSFFGPLINLAPWSVKLATSKKKARGLLTVAFNGAGLPIPEEMGL